MDLATLRRRRKIGWIFTLGSGTNTACLFLRSIRCDHCLPPPGCAGRACARPQVCFCGANLKLNGISYIAAVVWSYYDGALARRKWSTAWLEGLFMHLAGIQMGNILAFVFGNPVWVV